MPRYIEAEYVIKAIGADNSCGRCKQSRSDCLCHSLSRQDICGIIDDAPTADLATVKPGKWIRLEYDTFTCNLCGATFMLMQGISKMNYCPNCGAKMRKDDPSHPLADSDDIYGG